MKTRKIINKKPMEEVQKEERCATVNALAKQNKI